MASTILFSAVGEAAGRFTPYVAEIRAMLLQAGVPQGTPEAMTVLADRLGSDAPFCEELTALVRVIYAEEPAITYLELLGVLTVAAAGEQSVAEQPGEDAGLEASGRRVLNYLVEVRRVMKAEMAGRWEAEAEPGASLAQATEIVAAGDGDAIVGDEAVSPRAIRTTPSQRSALARALALAADGDATGWTAPVVDMLPEAPPTGEKDLDPRPAERVAEPVATPAVEEMAVRVEGSRRLWPAVAAGVLLGLLLGVVLGYLWARPAGTGQAPAAEEAVTEPSATPEGGDVAGHATAVPGRTRTGVSEPAEQPVTSESRRNKPAPHAAESVGGTRSGPSEAAAALPPSGATSRASAGSGGTARGGLTGFAAPAPPPVRAINLNAPPSLSPDRGHAGMPRVTVGSSGVMAANVLAAPVPAYPAQATAAGVQGEVVVEAVVGRDGTVTDTRLVSGPPLLQQAALEAVQRWRYRPYEVDGQPAEIVTTAHVQFRLN